MPAWVWLEADVGGFYCGSLVRPGRAGTGWDSSRSAETCNHDSAASLHGVNVACLHWKPRLLSYGGNRGPVAGPVVSGVVSGRDTR